MIRRHSIRIGENAEVHANGTIYRGIIKGMTEQELYLKMPAKTWVIETQRISLIRYLDDSKNLRESQKERGAALSTSSIQKYLDPESQD